MKKVFIALVSLIGLTANAQTQIGVGFNGMYATQKPANIDVISAGGASFYVSHAFKMKNNWIIEPQLSFSGSKMIMDGIFTKSASNDYEFKTAPHNYKLSQMNMYQLRVPVLLKYGIFKDTEGSPFGYIGVGPYIDYVLSAQQSFKIGNENFKEAAPIQNRMQFGLSVELSLYGKGLFSNQSNPYSLHIGTSYQLTDYLKDNTSFKSVMPYIKLGINL